MRRFIALVALLAGVASFASCSTTSGRTLIAEFTNVGDLVSRANVQQSDAVVGTVQRIELSQRKSEWVARVTMRLGPDARVTDGTRAVVRATSLLGEKYVDLEAPGDADQRENLKDGAVIPTSRTAKAPELEQAFSQLGAILASGGLTDLGRITTASAMILEGQEDDLGRVLDGTAKVIASIRTQREALADALDNLNQAAQTLAANKGTIDRALDVQSGALGIVAGQREQLDALITQLDRLAKPLAELTRAHGKDIDSQIKSLRAVVPKVYEVRATLDKAVKLLPPFAKLFARAIPGDYVQLDILVEALPFPLEASASASSPTSLGDVLMGATR